MSTGESRHLSLDPEQTAAQTRDALGIGSIAPVPDLLRMAENDRDYRIFVLSLAPTEAANGDNAGNAPGIDGLYQQNRGEPFILVNSAGRGDVRMRFTLAHEMGHHELRHGVRVDRHITFGTRDPKEVAANKFAAELLVPRLGVDDWLARNGDPDISLETVVRLALHFNVSAQTSLYRLENIKRVRGKAKSKIEDAIRDRHHYDLPPRLGLTRPRDTLSGLKRGGQYVPARMQAMVATLLREGLITREAAKARLKLVGENAETQLEELASISR